MFNLAHPLLGVCSSLINFTCAGDSIDTEVISLVERCGNLFPDGEFLVGCANVLTPLPQ